jgi:hypothetical protein
LADHAPVQGIDRVAAGPLKKKGQECMNAAADSRPHHRRGEAQGRAHVLEVGLTDRGGMLLKGSNDSQGQAPEGDTEYLYITL